MDYEIVYALLHATMDACRVLGIDAGRRVQAEASARTTDLEGADWWARSRNHRGNRRLASRLEPHREYTITFE